MEMIKEEVKPENQILIKSFEIEINYALYRMDYGLPIKGCKEENLRLMGKSKAE